MGLLDEGGTHQVAEDGRERVVGLALGRQRCQRGNPTQGCVLGGELDRIRRNVDTSCVCRPWLPEVAEQECDATCPCAEVENFEWPIGRRRERVCESNRPVFGLRSGDENRTANG